MGFGQNLQVLRKMSKGMTQEELAEKMGVSRQTISKWEMESTYPEMEKAIELCSLFACSLDDLLLGSIYLDNESYIGIRIEEVPTFRYIKYAVISADPEGDSKKHIQDWAESNNIVKPQLIGWDFPYVSQEQVNVFHMHGYAAACILPEEFSTDCQELVSQPASKYAVITIKDPFSNPFVLISNAYKTLTRYMEVNQLRHKQVKDVLPCFEKDYKESGIDYMDVYIAIE